MRSEGITWGCCVIASSNRQSGQVIDANAPRGADTQSSSHASGNAQACCCYACQAKGRCCSQELRVTCVVPALVRHPVILNTVLTIYVGSLLCPSPMQHRMLAGTWFAMVFEPCPCHCVQHPLPVVLSLSVQPTQTLCETTRRCLRCLHERSGEAGRAGIEQTGTD